MRIKYVTVGSILGPVITEQETSFLFYLIICRLGSDIFMSFSSPCFRFPKMCQGVGDIRL